MDSSLLYQSIKDVPLTFWITAIAIVLYTQYQRQPKASKKYKRLPPGPKGYPILGTFPSFLGDEAHIVFDRKFNFSFGLQLCSQYFFHHIHSSWLLHLHRDYFKPSNLMHVRTHTLYLPTFQYLGDIITAFLWVRNILKVFSLKSIVFVFYLAF